MLEKFEVHIGDRFWNSLYARPETVTDIYYLQGQRKYRIEFEEEGTDCTEQVTFKHFTKEHIVPITDEFDNIDTSKTYSHEEVKNTLLPNLQKNEEHYTKVMELNKEVYLDKNLKYGDAFTDTIKKYGYISALTRMHDKFNRIEQFILMGYEDNAEGLKDSLLDFANYAYMTVMELERDEQEALNQVEGEL